MEKYQTIVIIEKVKRKLLLGEKEAAYQMAAGVNIRKVKNNQDLATLAEAYLGGKDYETAVRLYKEVYEKTGSKRALSQIVYLLIKLGNLEDAELFQAKYEQMVPEDPYRLIYRFQIEKKKHLPFTDQIETLEQLKEEAYMERWAYELAKLYHKVGDKERCVRECNDLILWFGEGEYVEWAKVLRGHHLGEIDIEQLQIAQEELHLAEEVKQLEEGTDGTAESGITEPEAADIAEITEVTEANAEPDVAGPAEVTEANAEPDVAGPAEVTEANAEPDIAGPAEVTEANAEPDIAETTEDEQQNDIETAESEDTYADSQTVEPAEVFELPPKVVIDRPGNSKYQLDPSGRLSRLMAKQGVTLEEAFGNYACVDSIRKQLIRALDIIFDNHKRNINIILTGGGRCGKTTLAKRIAKLMQRFGDLKTTKVALVDAEKMNNIDLSKKQETLIDCCLIIEHAGKLKQETCTRLTELNPAFCGHTAVILEDNRNGINKLLRDNPEINRLYHIRIHLPEEYKQRDLHGFAYDYLIENEYEIDVEADKCLGLQIQRIIKEKQPDAVAAVISLVQKVIARTEKRTSKKLNEMATQGIYDLPDLMCVRKEDVS